MRQIEINGRKYDITCTMRALISYQRISGANPFDIEHMSDEQKVLYDVTMGWCMLAPADQETLTVDALMDGIRTIAEQTAFSKAVAEEIQRYLGVLPGDADQTDRHDIKQSEEAEAIEKNA